MELRGVERRQGMGILWKEERGQTPPWGFVCQFGSGGPRVKRRGSRQNKTSWIVVSSMDPLAQINTELFSETTLRTEEGVG